MKINNRIRTWTSNSLSLFLPCWLQLRRCECYQIIRSLLRFFHQMWDPSCLSLSTTILADSHDPHQWIKHSSGLSSRKLFSSLFAYSSLDNKSLCVLHQSIQNHLSSQMHQKHLHKIILPKWLLFCFLDEFKYQRLSMYLFHMFF